MKLHIDQAAASLAAEAFPTRSDGDYSPLVIQGEEEGLFRTLQDGKPHSYDRHDAKALLAALTDHLNGGGPKRAA